MKSVPPLSICKVWAWLTKPNKPSIDIKKYFILFILVNL
jgi:hypothetical protein